MMVVERVGAGSAEADFAGWYRREWPRVVAAMSLAAGDADVGREVAAEAFARALERWDRVKTMASPGGWTCRVALNLLRRRWRRAALERQASRGRPADMVVGSFEEDRDLWLLVAKLPPRSRAAVALRYGAGMTEKEVADALGIAPGTVAATLHAARKRLAASLRIDSEGTEVGHA